MKAALLFAVAQAVAQPSPRQQIRDSGMEIRMLRDSLRAEHCTACIDGQRTAPDHDGAAIAAKLARLHEQRVVLLQTLGAPSTEIADERLAAADAWMDAYSLDPTRTEHIDSAEQQILTAEKEAADPQVTAHKVVQQAKRRLATLTHQPADSQPPESTPPVCTPAADPSVGQSNPAVKQPAPASPAPAPPERRLKIRFEGGYALHMHEKDESETKRYRTAAGYLYTAFLGRFAFRRLAVAFGPYFSWFRTDPKGYDSHADVIDAGAHVELDVYFSARSRRVVSLHPFLEIGVGRVRPHYTEDSPMTTRFVGNATSGATFAPGLSLCFLEGSICPTVRFKVLPDLAGFDFSPQFGLAFNLPPARPLRRPHPADHANLSQHPHRAPPARRLSDRPFGDRAPRPVQRTAGRL